MALKFITFGMGEIPNLDEERVLSAIEEAGCELSRVSIAEHLENTLTTGGMSHSSKTTSRVFEAARSDTRH